MEGEDPSAAETRETSGYGGKEDMNNEIGG